MYTRACHLQTDFFTFSFSICMSFIYFSCLIAVARMSSIILNRDGKSKHFCLNIGIKKMFSHSRLILMLIVNFCRYPLSDWGNSLAFLIFSALLSWKYFIFVRCFICIYYDNHVAFALYSVSLVYIINWFLDVESGLLVILCAFYTSHRTAVMMLLLWSSSFATTIHLMGV